MFGVWVKWSLPRLIVALVLLRAVGINMGKNSIVNVSGFLIVSKYPKISFI